MAISDDEYDRFKAAFAQREMIGSDATAQWCDVTMRIADALEHQVMGMLIMQLTSMGGKPEMRNVKHREDCPGCVLTRQIVNQIQRASLIQAPQGIIKN